MADCHSQFDCQKKELYVPITFVPESVRNDLILRYDMQPLLMFWSWSDSFGLVNSQKAGVAEGSTEEQRGSNEGAWASIGRAQGTKRASAREQSREA